MKKIFLAIILTLSSYIISQENAYQDWGLMPGNSRMQRDNVSDLNTALKIFKDKDLNVIYELLEYIKNNINNIQKIQEGRPVTRDYRLDRIRIFYDNNLITGIQIG